MGAPVECILSGLIGILINGKSMKGPIGHLPLKGVQGACDGVDVGPKADGSSKHHQDVDVAVRSSITARFRPVENHTAEPIAECALKASSYLAALVQGEHACFLQHSPTGGQARVLKLAGTGAG